MQSNLKLALAAGALLGSSAAFAADQMDTVRVAQLTVKERLMSIEQINVTAEKEIVQPASEDAEVLALLAELEDIEQEDAER